MLSAVLKWNNALIKEREDNPESENQSNIDPLNESSIKRIKEALVFSHQVNSYLKTLQVKPLHKHGRY